MTAVRTLTHFELLDLRAAEAGRIVLTSTGFEDRDGDPVDEATMARLNQLWMDDYLDADVRGPHESAAVELTEKGRQALARDLQKSER